MRSTFASLIAATVLFAATTAEARDHRVDQIPYGDRFGCTSCHTSASGGGVFTGFGSDTLSALSGDGHVSERDVVWADVAALDSDRDGWTNGEELNDPMGTWTVGSPNPVGGRFYNPGDQNDHPIATCGDGRVTPPAEECDGTNHGGKTCSLLGLDEGTLTCKSDCTFERAGCGGEVPPEDDPDTTPADPDEPAMDVDEDAACTVTKPARDVGSGSAAAGLFAVLCALFAGRRRRR